MISIQSPNAEMPSRLACIHRWSQMWLSKVIHVIPQQPMVEALTLEQYNEQATLISFRTKDVLGR
jgi:hypothetical protein